MKNLRKLLVSNDRHTHKQKLAAVRTLAYYPDIYSQKDVAKKFGVPLRSLQRWVALSKGHIERPESADVRHEHTKGPYGALQGLINSGDLTCGQTHKCMKILNLA